MTDQVEQVRVVDDGLARVASDHYPVMITIRPDRPANGRSTPAPK